MLRSIFVVIIMTVGISAGLFSRFAALLLYVWFALFRPQEWLWVDVSALHLSLVLGVLFVVPCLLTGTVPNVTHPLSIGTLALLACGLLAQLDALRPGLGWEWLDYFSRLALVCLLAVSLIKSQKRLFWFAAVVALSFGFHSAKAGLLSLLGGGVRFADGQAGSFTDNNGYALGAAMVIPLLVATAQNIPLTVPFRKWVTLGTWMLAPLSAMTVVSTFSRGGLLALAAGALTLIMLQRQRLRLLVGFVIVLSIVLPFVPLPEGYSERVETIRSYDEIQEDSALSRLHFWRVALVMVNDNPLGVGLGNFESRYDEYDFSRGRFGSSRSVHNSHLEVLTEMGILGALVWVALLSHGLWTCLRIRNRGATLGLDPEEARCYRTYANACISSTVTFIVGGTLISLSMNDLTWFTLALVAALDKLSARASVAPERVTRPGDARYQEWAPAPLVGLATERQSRGAGV